MDGLFHVVRAFDDEDIIHVDDSVDPIRDLDTIMGELCKKDLVFWEKAMENEEGIWKKNPKMKGTKEVELFKTTMAKIKEHLEASRGIYSQEWSGAEVSALHMLTYGLS